MKWNEKVIQILKKPQWMFFSIVFLLVVGVLIVRFSYALFTTKVEKSGTLNIVAGDFSYGLASNELTNGRITVNPTTEKIIEITITNTNTRDTTYELYYKLISPSALPSSVEIGYASTTENPVKGAEIKKGAKKNIQIAIQNQSTQSITIEFGVQGGLIGKNLILDKGASLNREIIMITDKSQAPAPELVYNMIPVKYDEATGNWIKADSTNPINNPWYNYGEKQWANAVMVKENGTKARSDYHAAEVGSVVSMDDILQMLVWIPRYRYVMPAEIVEGQIDIVFENKDTLKSMGSATGTSYLTHPAFTFGDTELNGLWVGKYGSSPDIECTPATGDNQGGCDLQTINPLIKPNVKLWTGARVSTFFVSSRNVEALGNMYGYDPNEVDTHMMKNSEWGAVAYLIRSKYGRCTEGICTEKGKLESTTGNIYGVYDMDSKVWEYVMGNYNYYSGNSAIENSGFAGMNYDGSTTYEVDFPEQKYFDLYITDDIFTSCNGGPCLGHALSEISGWDEELLGGVSPSNPWFSRAVDLSDGTSATYILGSGTYGRADSSNTFRLVVSKEEVYNE